MDSDDPLYSYIQNSHDSDHEDDPLAPLMTNAANENSNSSKPISKVSGITQFNNDYPLFPLAIAQDPQRALEAVKNIGRGVNNSARVVTQSLMAPLNAIDDAVGGTNYSDIARNQNMLLNNKFSKDSQNSPAMQAGNIGGQIAATLPLLAIGGPEAQTANQVPSVANMLTGYAEKAGQGALLGGENAALTTQGTNENPLTYIRKGMETGGAFGAGGQMAADAGKNIMNSIAGNPASQKLVDLYNLAKDKYNIELSAPELSNSPFVKFMDSTSAKVPFSGGAERHAIQSQQFSKAVAGTFGAEDLTQEGMNFARQKLRNNYNSISDNTPTINTGNEFQSNIEALRQEASQVLGSDQMRPLQNQIDNIVGKIDNGKMQGSAYKAATSFNSPLDRLSKSNDPNVRYYAGQLSDLMDGALESSASPEDLSLLKSTNKQWKNMKTVEGLAAKSNVDGDISSSNLASAVRKSFKDYAYTGGGDLGELSQIGQLMKEPPSSGTAERAAAMLSMGFPAERLANGDVHGAIHDLLAAGGVVGGAKGAQTVLNSQWYKNRLLGNIRESAGNSLLPQIGQYGGVVNNMLTQNGTRLALPYSQPEGSYATQ